MTTVVVFGGTGFLGAWPWSGALKSVAAAAGLYLGATRILELRDF